MNIDKEALIATGRMTPAGLAEYEKRKPEVTGPHSFEHDQVKFSPDQEKVFRKNPAAWKFFESQPPYYRRVITWWVISAKQEGARAPSPAPHRRFGQRTANRTPCFQAGGECVTSNDVGPLEFLSRRARAMPDVMLAAMEILGLIAMLSIMAWLPASLELSLPFVALSMFGFWGIAEHARLMKDPLRRDATSVALAMTQRIAAAIGIIAVTMLVFSVLGLVIGPVVS